MVNERARPWRERTRKFQNRVEALLPAAASRDRGVNASRWKAAPEGGPIVVADADYFLRSDIIPRRSSSKNFAIFSGVANAISRAQLHASGL